MVIKKVSSHNVTFDVSLGLPLDPADVMSTIATPADDMSITVAPAGVVLVYKPRSTRGLFVRTVCAEHLSKRDDVRADSKCLSC